MVDATLEVRLEGLPGTIPVRAFVEVLRTSLDLLEQLERAEHLDSKKPGSWLIAELRNSSAAAALRRPDAPDVQTPQRLIDGVGQLRVSEGLPRYFSSEMAQHLVKIGRLIRQEGVSGVSFSLPLDGDSVHTEPVSEAVVSHALASIEGTERTTGSVAGLLDVINLRRGAHKVSLYDEDTRRAVGCMFPDHLFTTVKDALGHRVRALGEITRNRRGQVLRVDIDRIEVIPDSPSVPSVDELVGIAPWYTGDQSTEDFLRSVRGA